VRAKSGLTPRTPQARGERPGGLKCARSQVACRECEWNPYCFMYSERYVLAKELKRLSNVLDDARIIIKTIMEKR
jgi:hypothetical protein